MIEKKKLTIVTIISLILLLTVCSFAFSKSKMVSMGESVKFEAKKSPVVIAKVEGIPILTNHIEKDFVRAKALDSPRTKKEIFDRQVRYIVVVEEAKKLNLVPEDKEVHSFISELRNSINSNQEAKNQVAEYLTGLGLTEDEYFEENFNGYKEKVAYGKLMHQIVDDVEPFNEKDRVFQAYVDDLVNKAKIEVMRMDLIE